MSRDLTFVHLTDTHIAPGPDERVLGADTATNFRAAVQAVRDLALAPAFFLISGDLTRDGEPESYHHLGELIGEMADFGVPVLIGLGNHDRRVPFRQVFLGLLDAADEAEPYYYSHWIGELRVLMLDSKVPGEIWGRLGEKQLNWLADELAEPAPDGDLIVVHHPVLPRGVPRPDDYLLQDSAALAAVLDGRPILGLLAGHSHVSSVSAFAGILAATAPATAFLLDPSIRDGGRALDGAGFNICTVRDSRLIVNPVVLPGPQTEIYRYYSVDHALADATDPETASSRSEAAG